MTLACGRQSDRVPNHLVESLAMNCQRVGCHHVRRPAGHSEAQQSSRRRDPFRHLPRDRGGREPADGPRSGRDIRDAPQRHPYPSHPGSKTPTSSSLRRCGTAGVVGRPQLVYLPNPTVTSFTLPPRNYELLARVALEYAAAGANGDSSAEDFGTAWGRAHVRRTGGDDRLPLAEALHGPRDRTATHSVATRSS